MSSPNFDEIQTSPAPRRSDGISHHVRSNAPFPTSAAISNNWTVSAIDTAQDHPSTNEALLAEIENMDPMLRAMLLVSEGLAVTNPRIPTVEEDEPPSQFFDPPRVRKRSLQNRARLQQMKDYANGDSAPQVHPPAVSGINVLPYSHRHYKSHAGQGVPPNIPITQCSGVVEVGQPLQATAVTASDPGLPSLPESDLLEEVSRDGRRVQRSSDSMCMSGQYDEYRPPPIEFPRASVQDPTCPPLLHEVKEVGLNIGGGYINRLRCSCRVSCHREHAPCRPSRPNYEFSSPTQVASSATRTTSLPPCPSTITTREEALLEEWNAGFEKGLERGREYGRLSYKLKCYLDDVNLRVLIMGLAFIAYGLMSEKWKDAVLYVLLGWNMLAQAGR